MSNEDITTSYVARELDITTYTEALKNNKCPDCHNPMEQYQSPEDKVTYFMSCPHCLLFFIPKRTQNVRPPKDPKVSISQLEKAAELSGLSRYEPLNIHFFCEKCQENDMIKLSKKAIRAFDQGLKVPKLSGLEGMSHSLVRNRSRLADVNLTLPFTCRCGNRYYLDVTLKLRNKEDHYLFGVEMGYHADCMRCPMAWHISVGKKEFTFRCDLNLNCIIIKDKKHHFIMVDEDDDKNEPTEEIME